MKRIKTYKKTISNNFLRIYLYFFRRVFPKFRRDIMFYPRSISLQITNNCNLRCVMCWRSSLKKIDVRNFSLDEFRYVLNQIPTLKEINFIGLGEPLVHPKFFDLVRIAQSRNIKITFTTNATLLNKENIKKLTDNVSAIHISIEDLNPENYMEIRGVELEKVIRNLKNLRMLRKNINLTIQTVMMRRNIENMHKILYLAKEVGANVSFTHLNPSEKEESKQHLINIGRDKFEFHMDRINKLSKKLGVKVIIRPFFPKQKFCSEPFSSPYITINGDIYPCTFIVYPKKFYKTWYKEQMVEVPCYKFVMGNIFRESFLGTWNGKKFRLIRKIIKKGYPDKFLTPEQFNKLRKTTDVSNGLNYCKICSYRWSCSC